MEEIFGAVGKPYWAWILAFYVDVVGAVGVVANKVEIKFLFQWL